MADNIQLNSGTGGDVIAADDDGTAKHQQVKVEWGPNNTQNAVDAASGMALPVQGEAAENAAVTGNPVQVGGRYDLTPRTLNSGDVGAVALDPDGAVHVSDGGNTITVDGTITANAGTNLNTSALATETTAATIETNTDYGTVTGGGVEATALRVTIANDSTGLVSVDDGGGALTVDGTVTANAGTGTFTVDLGANNDVQGATAHDAAVSGNPFLLAGEARTTTPTAVADGDVVRLQADDQGRLITEPHAPRDLTVHNRITLTTTTETTLIAAGGAGVFHDLVFLSMSNESATEVRVDIADSTAGTDRISMDLAADGGGAVIPFPVPMTQATANNNWTATLSAAVSTVYITAIAVKRV